MDWPNTEIRISRDCEWYCDGVKMIREDIIELLSRNVVADQDEKWIIKMGNQSYPVLVEDVPFLVTEITTGGNKLGVKTNDNRYLAFPATGIEIRNDVPYASLFNARPDAKFSRNAFWKLSKFIKEHEGDYVIDFGGRRWSVRQ